MSSIRGKVCYCFYSFRDERMNGYARRRRVSAQAGHSAGAQCTLIILSAATTSVRKDRWGGHCAAGLRSLRRCSFWRMSGA